MVLQYYNFFISKDEGDGVAGRTVASKIVSKGKDKAL